MRGAAAFGAITAGSERSGERRVKKGASASEADVYREFGRGRGRGARSGSEQRALGAKGPERGLDEIGDGTSGIIKHQMAVQQGRKPRRQLARGWLAAEAAAAGSRDAARRHTTATAAAAAAATQQPGQHWAGRGATGGTGGGANRGPEPLFAAVARRSKPTEAALISCVCGCPPPAATLLVRV